MENLNRVLLENVLPAHVAEHFLGRNWKNEVNIQEKTVQSFFLYVELRYLSFRFYLLKHVFMIVSYRNILKMFENMLICFCNDMVV